MKAYTEGYNVCTLSQSKWLVNYCVYKTLSIQAIAPCIVGPTCLESTSWKWKHHTGVHMGVSVHLLQHLIRLLNRLIYITNHKHTKWFERGMKQRQPKHILCAHFQGCDFPGYYYYESEWIVKVNVLMNYSWAESWAPPRRIPQRMMQSINTHPSGWVELKVNWTSAGEDSEIKLRSTCRPFIYVFTIHFLKIPVCFQRRSPTFCCLFCLVLFTLYNNFGFKNICSLLKKKKNIHLFIYVNLFIYFSFWLWIDGKRKETNRPYN